MVKNTPKKVTQAPIDDELLRLIDATAGIVAKSRASFIRETCQQHLKNLQTRELDRLYVEGHRREPEDLGWAKSSAKLLFKRLPKEKW
jgi:hypothetical protein